MSKIRILFIHHGTGWGGAPINMINIINRLDKDKYYAHVLLLKESILSKYLNENHISFSIAESFFYKKFYSYFLHSDAGHVKFFQIKSLIHKSISWLFSRYFFAKKELNKFDFDILHLNSSSLTDWLAPGKMKAKVVYHIQEPISKGNFKIRYNFFRNQVIKHADLVFAISNDNANRINIPTKTIIVYNFIEDPKNLQFKSVNKSFLYVGGPAYIKGYYTLVEALKNINSDIQIIFLGDYPTLNTNENRIKFFLRLIFYPNSHRIRKSIQILNRFSNVIIHQKVSNISDYLNSTCALISPFSVPHFSRPVIEAFVHGKPVICSDLIGIDEVVKDGFNGLLFQKNNSKQLAEKINWMAINQNLSFQMGQNAKLTANKFLPDYNMEIIINSYKKLTEN